jgi:hypothetical protein
MAKALTGGCMCGAVRYEYLAEPIFAGNCHCRDCQRASGGGGSAVFGVSKSGLKITGPVKYHEVVAGSGQQISRGFCPTCGAPLVSFPSSSPDLATIAAGSLDDPSSYKPQMDIFAASAQPWDVMDPALPKFPKMPPVG